MEWFNGRTAQLKHKVKVIEDSLKTALENIQMNRIQLVKLLKEHDPDYQSAQNIVQNEMDLVNSFETGETHFSECITIRDNHFGTHEWKFIYNKHNELLGCFPFQRGTDLISTPIETTALYTNTLLSDTQLNLVCALCTSPIEEDQDLWMHILQHHCTTLADIQNLVPNHTTVKWDVLSAKQRCINSLTFNTRFS